MRELTVDDVIRLNKACLNPGEPFGILDNNRLESAIGNQWAPYPTDEQAIASVFRSLIQNHPFMNANKRTAVLAMELLADDIGRKVVLSDQELGDLVYKLAGEGGSKISVTSIANALFGLELEESLIKEGVAIRPAPNNQNPEFIQACKELAKNSNDVIKILNKYNMISSEPDVTGPSYILEDGSFVLIRIDTDHKLSSRAQSMKKLGVTYHEMIDDLLYQEGLLKQEPKDNESGSYVMYYMNAIRINARNKVMTETYIELKADHEPTSQQYTSLDKFIHIFEQACKPLDIITDDGKYFVKFDFADSQLDTYKVIGKIKKYYSSGVLKEARAQSAVKSNGIYSVLNDKWIKEPVAEDIPELDQEAFDKEFAKWQERYDKIMRGENFTADHIDDEVLENITRKIHYEYVGPIYRFGRKVKERVDLHTMASSEEQALNNFLYKAAKAIGYDRSRGAQVSIDPDLIFVYEPEIPDDAWEDEKRCQYCGTLLNDNGQCPVCDLGDESALEEDFDDEGKIQEIEDFIEDIYDLRKTSIANDGEYGIGNLVFKECRNLGYLDNLRELKNVLKSRKLSLE